MRLRVVIEGMVAVHGRRAVYTALAGVAGVTHAEVEMGSAVLTCDGPVREDDVRNAVAAAGCRVRAVQRELPTL